MKKVLAIVAGIGLLVFAGGASAAVVEKLPDLNNYGYYSNYISPTTLAQQLVDDFAIASPVSLNSVTWWGEYQAGNPSSDYLVRFFLDTGGGIPEINWFATATVVSVTGTPTGSSNLTGPVYRYTASFSPMNFAPGPYWISILSIQDPANTNLFIWANSYGTATGGITYRNLDGNPWNVIYGGENERLRDNMAFALNYTPVPEPSMMMLLGGGLVGLVGYGRRRMKR